MTNRGEHHVPLEIDCHTVKSKIDAGDSLLLIDCRERDEYDLVHIDGAMLVPMSEITVRVSELDSRREQPIVVHCHHGGRSLQVTNWLRQQGFGHVQSMAGGIDQWAAEIDRTLTRY